MGITCLFEYFGNKTYIYAMSLENFFPYRPLEQGDIDTLTQFCGGTPVTRPEQLQDFFQYLAIPMLANGLAKQLLILGAEACTETLDTSPQRGKEMFHRGALLYTAVLAQYSPLSKVPCEPEVFFNLAKAEGEEFIWAGNEQLHDESPTFCGFMGEVSQALELFSPIDQRLAIAGAGLVHIMTTESLRPGESHAFELDHPELADLEPLFGELGDQ
jgi:hypothetical protein